MGPRGRNPLEIFCMKFMIDLFCLKVRIHCTWIELEGTVLFWPVNGLTRGNTGILCHYVLYRRSIPTDVNLLWYAHIYAMEWKGLHTDVRLYGRTDGWNIHWNYNLWPRRAWVCQSKWLWPWTGFCVTEHNYNWPPYIVGILRVISTALDNNSTF